jgi:2-hydroxy-6-oxonona-2,4-dienedioate hydrolase
MLAERWDVVEGLRMHAYVGPDSAGKPPLALVHGLGVSSRYLLPTAELLLSDFAVFAPDLPGFGRSERPAEPLDVGGLADSLGDWLRTMRIERPTLLANSFGCQVIVDLALRKPEAAARLVLVGPTVDRHARTAARQIIGLLRDSLAEPLSLDLLVAREYLAAGPLRIWRTGQAALADRIEDKVSLLEQPVLVVRGERDGFVSERWARELAARAKHGSYTRVADAAHAVNFNSPDALAALVRRFALVEPGSR